MAVSSQNEGEESIAEGSYKRIVGRVTNFGVKGLRATRREARPFPRIVGHHNLRS